MILKHITYGDMGLIKGIVLSDSGQEYVTSLDCDSGDTWCTCPQFVFQKAICKHILFFMDKVEIEEMKTSKKFRNVLTGCTTVDSLLGGGIPLGTITSIFAEPGTGKTLLSAQIALSTIKETGKEIIVVETEGNREQDYLQLLFKFKDRWGLTEEEITSKINFQTVLGDYDNQAIVTLLKMVGYQATMERSKKGDKYTVRFDNCKPILTDKELKSSSIIIIDSLTKPIKASIGHKTQNLPARADMIARFFDRLVQMSTKYEIGVVINHHASVNKAQLFGRDFGRIYGGDEVYYNSKYVLLLLDSDMSARTKYGKGARRVSLIKHPFNPVTGDLYPIHLKSDYGFTDEE